MELTPDRIPVFGYPAINYTPRTGVDPTLRISEEELARQGVEEGAKNA